MALVQFLEKWGKPGKMLLLPPDQTRPNAYAGPVMEILHQMLPQAVIDILPALGTHEAMTKQQWDHAYPGVPYQRVAAHNWKTGVEQVGEVSAEVISRLSDGMITGGFPVEINRMLLDKSYDLILSIGQVVPHEVVGMSNYIKNILVGCGGRDIINNSHYLGGLYGVERLMGRDNSPVHRLFDYIWDQSLHRLPIAFLMTVTSPKNQEVRVHSLALGRGRELFGRSVEMSQRHNLTYLEEPLERVVVYLDPEEFRSTWIGNKAIYRTRMAIADGGELLIIAPGIRRFGEDPDNDTLIRKYGYYGRDSVLKQVAENADLRGALGVAAHLIHGCPDGRFTVTYAPGHLTRDEVEAVGFSYMPLEEALSRYDPSRCVDGWNGTGRDRFYYVGNPALGLWAHRERFEKQGEDV